MNSVARFAAVAAMVLACVSVAQAVDIDTVTVGSPGNVADTRYETPGYGGVDYVYNIGKFEVTAGQYTEFLNAVAMTDTYGLYNPKMDSEPKGCQITQNGSSPNFTYDFSGRPSGTEADWADRPVNYISWGDAARFANWLHNGQPTGAQDLSTTEDGSYYLNGATSDVELMAVVRKVNATWVIPSEDEWYKAAYHYNDGVTGNYYDYPTCSDSRPVSEPCPGGSNSANYHDNGVFAVGSPFYRNEVGCYVASDSCYGTFDMGGNVSEWTEAILFGVSRGARGGSFEAHGEDTLHAAYRASGNPTVAFSVSGFRVAEVSEQAPVPAVSEWGVVTMALLVLTAGTVLLARRRAVTAT